jgi:8-oxo-dGTP pyrophosphatase MutT (NUDIX family)
VNKNPWRTLSTKTVYKNPWITVREDQVVAPTGKEGIYGVVSSRVATGVVPLTENNEIYLVGQYRYPTDIYSWELPEGGAEEGEHPLDAIKRELKEEAGLVAKNWEQLGGRIQISNSFSAEVGYLYLATNLEQATTDPDDTEVLEIRKVPLIEALDMCYSGEIQDSLTIIGLHRTCHKLGIKL